MLPENALQIAVASRSDIAEARERGRCMALQLGFTEPQAAQIAAAIAELARNILQYAHSGAIVLQPAREAGRVGMTVEARDRGPGIECLDRALIGGYSTSGGLGLGLSGVGGAMDALAVSSVRGSGTTVRTTKWRDA